MESCPEAALWFFTAEQARWEGCPDGRGCERLRGLEVLGSVKRQTRHRARSQRRDGSNPPSQSHTNTPNTQNTQTRKAERFAERQGWRLSVVAERRPRGGRQRRFEGYGDNL